MCNKQKNNTTTPHEEIKDYRFIDYRLTQIENNLRQGQQRLEQEYKEQNRQIMQTLTAMQEGLNKQNSSIVELTQRVHSLEDQSTCVDKLREATVKNTTEIKELERRMDIYKQILVGVIVTLGASILVEFIKLI